MGQDLDEQFDVVDTQDRVTGQATRREVHARNLRHRAVHIFVVNKKGAVFLHQRSLTKDSFPGLWTSSCAGHVAAGDDYDETALRELEEELGVKAGFGDPALQLQLRRLLKIDAHKETGWEFVWVYLAKGDGPFVLNSTEIRKGGWYALAAVDCWLERRPAEFAESFRFLWPRVRDELEV